VGCILSALRGWADVASESFQDQVVPFQDQGVFPSEHQAMALVPAVQ
jgi:hypothetical protein